MTWWFIRRCSAYAAVTSAMGAALLLADAWFDVCTSAAGMAQLVAVLQAALLEIPLACAALWFAATAIRGASLHHSGVAGVAKASQRHRSRVTFGFESSTAA